MLKIFGRNDRHSALQANTAPHTADYFQAAMHLPTVTYLLSHCLIQYKYQSLALLGPDFHSSAPADHQMRCGSPESKCASDWCGQTKFQVHTSAPEICEKKKLYDKQPAAVGVCEGQHAPPELQGGATVALGGGGGRLVDCKL